MPAGGGRVTELTARPLLNALWPELAGFVQPLGGEYAGRRSALEQVPFVSAYGVEVGLLIDLLRLGGLSSLAQVDLGVRRHTSQSEEALGAMAGQVVSTVLARAAAGRAPRLDASGLLTQFRHDGTGFVPRSSAVAVDERPPMATMPRVPLAAGGAGGLTRCRASVVALRESPQQGTDPACWLESTLPPVSGPEVVAHRGATAEAPEHTLAAYRHAADIGADAVECDVRMTRDGVLVCVHDRRIRQHLQRPRRGLRAAPATSSSSSTSARAAATGRNRWADDEITAVTDEPDVENGLVLTLDRLLEYVTATPGTVRLAIETKHPTRHTRKVEEALVDCLRRFGLLGNGRPVEWAGKPAVRMMSFSQLAVTPDARPGARHAHGAADRQAAAARPARAAERHRDGDGPGHRAAALGPGLRRRCPRRRQGGARLDGQPHRRHGLRAGARHRRGDHRPTRTSCSAGSGPTRRPGACP